MKFFNTTSLTRTLNRASLVIKKHSPEILMSVGVAGTVVSTVMACKATLKVNDILADTKAQLDTIHEVMETPELEDQYSPEDAKKDTTIVYVQTGIKFAKLYAPAVAVGIASIACIIGSNRIMNKRNVALAAAYTAVSNDFKGYRSRLIERFGKELDRELKYNIKTKQIEEIVVDEDGKEEIVQSTIEVSDPSTYSLYTKCFDETCKGWTRNAEMNLYFLRQVETWANEKLVKQGHLTLNEVWEQLGIPKTAMGAEVGWIYDEEDPIGDNKVNFNIYELHNEQKRAFVNGYEKSIWLDFNVDGPILHLI